MNKRVFIGIASALFLSIFCYILSNNFSFCFLIFIYFGLVSIIISKGYRNNVIIMAFLICFFVFLMGRPIIYEIFHLFSANAIPLEAETRSFTYWCLIISLLAIAFGYILAIKTGNKNKVDNEKVADDNFVKTLQKITKKTTIFLYIFVIIENVLRYVFIKEVGYTTSFIAESSYELPYGLHALVDIAPVSLCLFLATLPKKKDTIVPFLLFFIANAVLAMAGSRFEIISCLLLIIIYAVLRTRRDGEIWIKKKQVAIILVLTPLVASLLYAMTYWRDGKEYDSNHHPIADFMLGVGGSSDLIGAVKEYGDSALSKNTIYSFGGVWRRLNNSIAKWTGEPNTAIKAQTITYAREGHSLSSAMTYYFFPERYLKGFGLGGCYIAELYHDFSLFGVVLGNLIIGFVIGKNRKLSNGKVFRNFFCLFLVILLLRTPRDSFDYIIVELTGIKNIIFWLAVVLFSKLHSIKMSKKRNMEGADVSI